MVKIFAERCGKANDTWTMQGRTLAQGCFLHGKLELMNGFDLFVMDTSDYEELVSMENGKETVMVTLANGKIEVADFYYWLDTTYKGTEFEGQRIHGFVVLPWDKDAVCWAKAHQRVNAQTVGDVKAVVKYKVMTA